MKLTLAYVLTLIVATILFDAVQYARGGWEWTISYLVLTRSIRHPIIPFVLGVIIGHLFWSQPCPEDHGKDELTDVDGAG